MKKRILPLLIVLLILVSASTTVSAEPVLSNNFELNITIPDTEEFQPVTMRFNLLTESGTWVSNKSIEIDKPGVFTLDFPICGYEVGFKFNLVATAGVSQFDCNGSKFKMYEECTLSTYLYTDENGNSLVWNKAYITAIPITATYEYKVEKFVNEPKISSDTEYLIWISKKNFKVNVFLNQYGRWDYIKDIDCSIGAEETPTITGEYIYHQYQTKWQYDGYYVGPIMRFYKGYAIHTTLINNNGTDRDARVGKMISHGCVRVRPDNMSWLVYYIPIGTKVYVTEE